MKKLILIVWLCCLFPLPAQARIFGLVVGINNYVEHQNLRGAVNDARDIADALKTIGAEKVILLLDEKATYDAIKQGWYQLIREADSGDTLVFSYAGHGGREPERIPGSEDDHKDDAFVLGGFQENGPGSRERIIDNEINGWLSAAKEQSIIMIADSCFSGTMLRGHDPRASQVIYRTIDDYGPLVNDYHAPPAPKTSSLTTDDLTHVTFYSSSRENEKTPEILIDDVPRGALSWAFARALRGAVGSSDSRLTRQELDHYIRENIQMRTEGRQHPTFLPGGRGEQVLFHVASSRSELPPLNKIKVKIINQGASSISPGSIEGGQAISDTDTAALVWDMGRKQVVSGLGDVITWQLPASRAAFQRVVDKWRLLALIRRMSEQDSLVMRVSKGDVLYHKGDTFSFSISENHYPCLTLFSLEPDGKVTLLYPLKDDGFNDPFQPESFPFTLPLQITEPHGVEHLVAIVSAQPLTGLHTLLTGSCTGSSLVLEKYIRRLYLNDSSQSGVFGMYSSP